MTEISLSFFTNRPDLRNPREGLLAVRHAKGLGVLLRRKNGWFCSNDIRWALVGIEPNDRLVQPTLGPFPTMNAAFKAYAAERTKRHSR